MLFHLVVNRTAFLKFDVSEVQAKKSLRENRKIGGLSDPLEISKIFCVRFFLKA